MVSNRGEAATTCLEQAAEWYWTLRDPAVSDEKVAQWQAWLAAVPEHKRAFARIQAALASVDQVEAPSWPSEEELLGDSYDGSMPIDYWREQQGAAAGRPAAASAVRSGRKWAWPVAAGLVLAVLGGFLLRPGSVAPPPPDYVLYQTQPAEHRQVALPDASTVELGGRSTISVAYQKGTRVVVLRQGEAYFQVVKDDARPFVVEAQGRVIKAVGTAFNVSKQDERVVLTVTEGSVIVAPELGSPAGSPPESQRSKQADGATAVLNAGQMLVYDDKTVRPIAVSDPDDALAWREGMLKYRGEPLRYVIEDVRRYVQYSISLGDDSVGEVLFTGTVFQKRVDSWVFGLEDALPVVVTRVPDGVVVSIREK